MRRITTPEEPALSLDVYCNKLPDIRRTYLPKIVRIEERRDHGNQKSYRIKTAHSEELLFVAGILKEPTHYAQRIACSTAASDDDLGDLFDDARNENIDVPEQFLDRICKENGLLTADKEQYRYLQRYPRIKELLREYAAFWRILEFTKGEPVHHMTVEISHQSVISRGLPHYLSFVRQMCTHYEGIACDEEGDHAGIPYLKRYTAFGSPITIVGRKLEWREGTKREMITLRALHPKADKEQLPV